MSKTSLYRPSHAHRDAVHRAGFDFDDPDKRRDVSNPSIAKLISAATLKRDRRAEALIKVRNGISKILTRAILLGITSLPLLGISTAFADPIYFDPFGDYVEPPKPERLSWISEVSDHILKFALSLPHEFWVGTSLFTIVALVFLQLLVQLSHLKLDSVSPHPEETNISTPSIVAVTPTPASIQKRFHWHIHGDSITGQMRKENQDCFAVVRRNSSEVIATVADGAGGHEGGREASEQCTASITSRLKNSVSQKTPLEQLRRAVEAAQTNATTSQLKGITTVIIVWFWDDWIHFATLGDGALSVIWPDGMVSQHLTPHHVLGEPKNRISGFIGRGCTTQPRLGSIKLEPGCQVLMMSDGASDIFPFEDFAQRRDRYHSLLCETPNNPTSNILGQLEQARDPETAAYYHKDNMTLIMAALEQLPEEDMPHEHA